MTSIPDEFVVLALLVKPQGLRGELKGLLESDFPERLTGYGNVIWRRGSEQQTFRVVNARRSGRSVFVSLDGVVSRDQAQALVGGSLCIRRTELPVLTDDAFYWADLVGCRVVSTQQTALGDCTDVMRLPAQDILVVTAPEGGEILVPFVNAIVLDVDAVGRKIVIDPPKGMFGEHGDDED